MENKRIYLDNAATTPIDEDVIEAMLPYLTTHFGNPSSIYSYGREAKLAVENARKKVAQLLNAHPAEIFFTSGGTESDNTAIYGAVKDLGCRHIITSTIEHHAVEHCVAALKCEEVQVSMVNLLENGHIDVDHLKNLLANAKETTLVSLMHANNEIGNLLDIEFVGNLCKEYKAYFHSDTVQTIGHYPFNLREMPVHFATAAAHKFHGPKGVGMLYINENVKIKPVLKGGAQERNMRAGTENVYGIVGFAKALEKAMQDLTAEKEHIFGLKKYMAEELQKHVPSVRFNGDTFGKNLYTILNVSFPKTEKSEMILFNLDIHNVCVSGGSACTSGAMQGSHVIQAICNDPNKIPVRFSFSKYNTKEEIDRVVQLIKEVL